MVQPFNQSTVVEIARILGDTNDGLSNSQIDELLRQANISDPNAQQGPPDPRVERGEAYVIRPNKRDRIAQAILSHQSRHGSGAALVGFLNAVMRPNRYLRPGGEQQFEDLRQRLSQILVFETLRINDEGKVAKSEAARTLSDAERLAGRLTTELERRGTHPEVLKYCTKEILAKSNFHAALEALKGVAARIRGLSGLVADGATLFREALSCRSQAAVLKLSPLQTETEKGEQTGFMNLLIGLFGFYRNPLAHEPRVVREADRPVTEQELLELFSTLSLVHHRLDTASR